MPYLAWHHEADFIMKSGHLSENCEYDLAASLG